MTNHKTRLENLSAALRELHRELLMREAKKLETEGGRKLNPYELLNLSLNDPRLAWLRKFSALIVRLDTMIDEVPKLSATEETSLAEEVSAVIENGQSDEDFWSKYTGYLAHDPDIIMKHSALKDLLKESRTGVGN